MNFDTNYDATLIASIRKEAQALIEENKKLKEQLQATQTSLVVERNVTQFEPGNPYRQDLYHMGTMVGSNIEVMYPCHTNERCNYLFIVNKLTGERIRVDVK
jgi:hypothetical protein